MRRHRSPLAIALLLMMTCRPVSANLIDATHGAGAGSFELGAFVDGGGISYAAGPGYMGLVPGDNTIVGWTVGGPGDGVDWLIEPLFNAVHGAHSVDLQHLTASTISTIIPTVVGATYRLSFSAATFENCTADGLVSAGSLVNQPFSAPYSSLLATQAYAPFSFTFVATDASTTVTFKCVAASAAPIHYGPVIDDVSVTQDTTPARSHTWGRIKSTLR